MKKILSIIMLICAFEMNAQVTKVSGNQCGIWSDEIHLTEDVVVLGDETLTIKHGTTVIADGYYGITVYGNLVAIGTEKERITFTVADTTGYSDYEHFKAGAWKGITFAKPGKVDLSYCDFSYGKTELDSDGGAIRVYYCNRFNMDNCTFHHNTARKRGGAIYAENSVCNIHNCEIYDNFATGFEGSYCWGTGFQFLKCDLTIHDVIFHDNYSDVGYGGGMNIDSCNMDLNNAIFYNNVAVNAGGLGIQRCKEYNVRVSNMLAYNNAVRHYGGGLAMATSDPELNNLTIVNNYCGGGGGAGMQTAFDAAPILNNCIFWGNHAISAINENDTTEYYDGSQIWLWGSDCRPVFKYGVVQYGMDSIAGREYLTEDNYQNMIEEDPLFINEGTHNYQLLAKSPCIDKGNPRLDGLFIPLSDLAGNIRIYNNRIDMGCYEWNRFDVNEVFADDGAVFVYPNPLNDNAFCVIKLNKQADVVLRLITLDGKEVYSEHCGILEAGENHISLDGMLKNVEKSNELYLLMIGNQCVKVIY